MWAELEARQAKDVPMLNRVVARFRRAPKPVRLDSADFTADHNRINVASPRVFQRDPVNLIRMFHLAQRNALAFHPEALRLAPRPLNLIDKSVRQDQEANRLILATL